MFHYSVLSLVTEKEDCNINRKAIFYVFLPLQSTAVGSDNFKKKIKIKIVWNKESQRLVI